MLALFDTHHFDSCLQPRCRTQQQQQQQQIISASSRIEKPRIFESEEVLHLDVSVRLFVHLLFTVFFHFDVNFVLSLRCIYFLVAFSTLRLEWQQQQQQFSVEARLRVCRVNRTTTAIACHDDDDNDGIGNCRQWLNWIRGRIHRLL